MFDHMIVTILAGIIIALHLAIAFVLVRKYLRTREIGFIWLGIAVVLWPLVTQLLNVGERLLVERIAKGHVVGFFPFSLVESRQITIGSLLMSLSISQNLIGVALLLVAVLYISKLSSHNSHEQHTS